ncbi:hypothetical protein DFP90_1181 [Aestuariispira insulae]|uniref:Uncharacterized protein n=1 Tax=Aestuariispira insulae TaxID=1461337 RepID=A0A3D9H2Q1_9PROT|nr:hypothetical protein DFP90_1181 [Aestuariispira insulae]
MCFDGLVRTVIKTGNSHSFKEAVSDQIATTSSKVMYICLLFLYN